MALSPHLVPELAYEIGYISGHAVNAWHPTRSTRGRAPARCRRDGRGVPGARHASRPPGGAPSCLPQDRMAHDATRQSRAFVTRALDPRLGSTPPQPRHRVRLRGDSGAGRWRWCSSGVEGETLRWPSDCVAGRSPGVPPDALQIAMPDRARARGRARARRDPNTRREAGERDDWAARAVVKGARLRSGAEDAGLDRLTVTGDGADAPATRVVGAGARDQRMPHQRWDPRHRRRRRDGNDSDARTVTASGASRGHPGLAMGPERVVARAALDERTDVFALRMRAVRVPDRNAGRSRVATPSRSCGRRWTTPSTRRRCGLTPSRVRTLLARCLEKDPERRVPAAGSPKSAASWRTCWASAAPPRFARRSADHMPGAACLLRPPPSSAARRRR